MDKKSIMEMYSEYNQSKEELEHLTRGEGHEDMVTNKLKKLSDGKGLNLGSGTMPRVENVVNLDIVNFKNTHLLADAFTLPFKDNSFDFVYGVSIIEYTDDLRGALKEFKRVIKTNGWLYLDETIDTNHLANNFFEIMFAYINGINSLANTNGLYNISRHLHTHDRLVFEDELSKIGTITKKQKSESTRLIKYDYQIKIK